MFSPLVTNPPLPFFGPIPGGLHPGKTITIYGYIPANASRFSFDFVKSGQPSHVKPDILFHVNFRYDENCPCLVRNSFLNGCWGPEERHPPYIPVARANSFEIMFLVDNNCFKFALNGRHYTEYAHRAPFQDVTTLEIEGTVIINRIEYRENVKFPSVLSYGLPNTLQICPPGPVHAVPLGGNKYQPVYNPALPFTYPIRGGLQADTNIYISGRPSLNPHRFEINFQCGASNTSDIALHFNPRFDQRQIVRNSRINSSWGSEERHGPFNFQGGITFDMCIQVQQSCFSVLINGFPFVTFVHRVLPTNRINTLNIEGDVVISSVQFK